ncbi:MAG TPA: transporter substrate-binding domain-containing protein [Vicinamibacterales bacterium]|nr:transporter substrate-binding domain-containing protein [Vicinamibacterales bacterium]
MRSAVLMIVISMAAACSDAPPTASRKATTRAAAAAPVDIPAAPDQPINALEKNTKALPGDLDAVIGRGYLRILVAPSRAYFETVDGRHHGLAVDAGVELAKTLTEDAKREIAPVFIETREDQLLPSLLAGKGDVAANVLLTITRDEQFAFAPPVKTGIRELVVTDVGKPMVSLEDVGGRTIYVRKNSDHHLSLIRLNEQLAKNHRRLAVIIPDEKTRTDEDLLDSVNAGRIRATIVDDYIFDRWQGEFTKLAKTNRDIAVSQDGVVAWVTRKDAPALTALLKDFFSTHKLTF